MMKKKVLFMVINMNVGGTERALLNMINEMPKNEYEITILMLEKFGGFLDNIPNSVNVEYLSGYENYKYLLNESLREVIKSLFKELRFFQGSKILFLYLISLLKKERSTLFSFILRKHPTIKKEYDVAIAYAGPMDFISYFIVKKINAKKKIQWIHFDITKIGFNKIFSKKIYSYFNKIIVVSEEARTKLLTAIPEIKNKTEVFHNIVPVKEIITKSHEDAGFMDDFNGFRILTIGRLAFEKGQDIAIRVMAKLKEEGYQLKWYCIGSGNRFQEYEGLIKEYNLENEFFLLGEKTNPYVYLKQCDLYVQPSRYEGFCITTLEAKCFNKPIVSTLVNGINEQIVNGKTGLVVEINEEGLFQGIKQLLDNKKLRDSFSNNLRLENEKKSKIEKIKFG